MKSASLPSFSSDSSPAAATVPPRSIMVRSLRRRLWKALQEEDIKTATLAYTATKADYDRWLDQEIAEEQRRNDDKMNQKKERRGLARSMSIRKIGLSTRRTQDAVDGRKTMMLDISYQSNLPILQTELHPNDEFQRDDFYGPFDPYDDDVLLPPPSTGKKTESSRPKRRVPRLAGFFSWKSTPKYDWDLSHHYLRQPHQSKEEPEKVDENMTTLLHEACRIGCADFVRLLLNCGGNPNVRNGQQRTALHMVGGGLTEQEIRFAASQVGDEVGIRTPIIALDDDESNDKGEHKMRKKAARAVGRLFQKLKDGQRKEDKVSSSSSSSSSDDNNGNLTSQRMDTLLVILSWVHPDDGTPSSGESPSINSVDIRGRTALHYAAELGRTEMCLTILSSFGAILTVVDESGQTPGELAAEEKYADLAAQLEARALLYTDPYGLDEDLMGSVWGDSSDSNADDGEPRKKNYIVRSSHSKLAPPFSWFETWNMEKVRTEREKRIKKLAVQMTDALLSMQDEKESKEFMYNHGIDDSEAAETCNSDQAVTCFKAREIHVKARPIVGDSVECRDAHTNATTHMSENEAAVATTIVEVEIPLSMLEDGVIDSSAEIKKDGEEKAVACLKLSSSSEMDDLVEEKMVDKVPLEQDVLKESPNEIEDHLPINGKEDLDVENDNSWDAIPDQVNPLSEVGPVETLSEFQMLANRLQQSHVETFARAHAWNLNTAMKAFQEDPFTALKDANIEISDEAQVLSKKKDSNDGCQKMCLICCDEFESSLDQWVELASCDHAFCYDCLSDYITECAKSKETGIFVNCPHHECSIPLAPEELERLAPSPDVHTSLLATSDQMFVATAEDLCFCPHPGCEGVVRRILPPVVSSAKLDRDLVNMVGAVCTSCGGEGAENDNDCPLTYEGVRDRHFSMTRNLVEPKRAHRFCFSCGSESIHWPVLCKTLDDWTQKISEELHELDEPGTAEGDNDHFDNVAQRLWMKANTRPCPKCKCPIEKNDGCNHMTCSNRSCRHEFCWICREDWKLHNTETGGFFRCNRWQADDNHQYYDTPPPPEERAPEVNNDGSEVNYGTALHSSRVAWKKSKEMGLFLHHYRRWSAHNESANLERQMAETSCSRLSPVVEAAIDFNGHEHFDFGGKGLSFIHSAFSELLECRSLLQHSYVFAFFRYPIQFHLRRSRTSKSKEREKMTFEQLQAELEMLTEQMSDIVARKHLRATQMQIMFLTTGACQKRSELTSFMLSLLNEQRKDEKEEAERLLQEKNRPAVDRLPALNMSSLGSLFEFPTRDYATRYQQHFAHHHPHPRDHVSNRLRRLMDTPPYRNRGPFYDSDEDDDDFRMRPIRTRFERTEEEAVQDAVRSFFQFGSDDPRNDNEITRRFQDWGCNECTYMNAGGRRCAMCGSGRR